MISQRWQSKRPQPSFPHKHKKLNNYPQTKRVMGECWSPLKKLQQHSETTATTKKPPKEQNLRIAYKKAKNGFILPASSHPLSWDCSSSIGKSPTRKNLLAGKGRTGYFPSLLGYHMKNLLQFHSVALPSSLDH